MTQTKKIALITGGSRGLGKNMALSLAKKGTDIILTYNTRQQEAAAAVKEINDLGAKAVALQLNMGDVKSFDTFFTSLATVLKDNFQAEQFHYLVNNASMGVHASFAATTEEEFDRLMNVHFKGVFFLTQKALPLITDGGGIVNISTGLARFSTPGYAAYASMKGAIETLTKYLAKELGPRGIRVNVMAPGAIETDFGAGAVRDNKDLNSFLASQTALGRVGLPDDVGGVVAFLCSDDAKWVNAQRLEASGGMFL
ncbi:MAG TPA: SDR family oxidoreductase [Chitinophaga sp.]|uniref:SDR family NAD(P)-dependent oxidoreductase n=1 Tax=Chitinophaga sp. TaxID=1869181 RepID=UPI002BB740F6|nr:SDR family oxidoreductase [Chitinophaga sp.]HVI46402.1 SDR family oxidoreductase [Chitinophaga sp.]